MVDSNSLEIFNEKIRSAVQGTAVKYMQTDKVEVSITAATKAGDNFKGELLNKLVIFKSSIHTIFLRLGIVYRVNFSKLEPNEKTENVSKMIVKESPQNPARRFLRPCYLREIYLYDEVTEIRE